MKRALIRNPLTGEREWYEDAQSATERREHARLNDRAHDRRKNDRRRLDREIVAWDGEGITPDREGAAQPYVLLMNSAGGTWTEAAGLSTTECFRALVNGAAASPGARHVAFGLSYDANQWLRDVPEDRLTELYRRGGCWWKDWRIEYRPRRTFYLKQMATGRSITLWDIQTWYASSLQDAITRWLPDFDWDDAVIIEMMKRQRRNFTWGMLPEMKRYCAAELRATVDLARTLFATLTDVGLRPQRIDGPGGAASRLLQDHGVKAHLPADTPRAVERAALMAYSGGRIEPLAYGVRARRCYEYDLHSAYPWALAELPSLRDGKWQYVPGVPALVEPWALYRVRWSQPRENGVGGSRYYPFPWRDRTGGMFYPSAGDAWIWGPEIAAYLETRDIYDCDVELVGAWRFIPADRAARPFGFMRDLYRARVARAGDANAASLLKAAMVATYGKLVQSVGWRDEPPPYYSIVWGGLVTSLIRARMLRAAALDPDAVIMFATDALYTTRRLHFQRGERGEDMGQWGETKLDGLTVVQSGVYFIHQGDRVEAVTRGYTPRDLSPEPDTAAMMLRSLVVDGWRAGAQSVPVPQTRFVSLASWQEIAPGPPAWRSWVTDPRELALWPTGKRTGAGGEPWRTLVASDPMPVVESLGRPRLATAYSRTWRPSPQALNEGISPAAYEEEIEEAVL